MTALRVEPTAARKNASHWNHCEYEHCHRSGRCKVTIIGYPIVGKRGLLCRKHAQETQEAWAGALGLPGPAALLESRKRERAAA